MCRRRIRDNTEDGPEIWSLFAPRKRQAIGLGSLPRATYDLQGAQMLSSLLMDWDAFPLLHRKPIRAHQSTNNQGNSEDLWKTIAPDDRAVPTSRIERLPAEVLFMVFSMGDLEIRDLVALGLCSRTLWAFMLTQMLNSSCGAWAGTEIICAGNYVLDLPEMLSEEDFMTQRSGRGGGWASCQARRWIRIANRTYSRQSCHFECPWLRALQDHQSQASITNSNVWYTLEASLRNLYSWGAYPMGTGWVLRNLTTKEYLRLKLQTRDGRAYVEIESEHRCSIPVEQALLARIRWTRGSYTKSFQTPPPQPEWVGHRFEIVFTSDLSGTSNSDWPGEWRDVTSEVCVGTPAANPEMRLGQPSLIENACLVNTKCSSAVRC